MAFNFPTVSGSLRTLSISRYMRSTMSLGVPAGASIRNQPTSSKPGKVSAIAGTSSKPGMRFAQLPPSARSSPALRRGERDREYRDLGAAGDRVLHAERNPRVGHEEDVHASDLVEPRRHHAGEI